jgi:hypothetical protein
LKAASESPSPTRSRPVTVALWAAAVTEMKLIMKVPTQAAIHFLGSPAGLSAKKQGRWLFGYASWATLISMLAIISCCHIHYLRRQPDLLLSTLRGIRATVLRHNDLSTSVKLSSFNHQQLEDAAGPASEEEADNDAGPEYLYSADPLTFMSRKQLGQISNFPFYRYALVSNMFRVSNMLF